MNPPDKRNPRLGTGGGTGQLPGFVVLDDTAPRAWRTTCLLCAAPLSLRERLGASEHLCPAGVP